MGGRFKIRAMGNWRRNTLEPGYIVVTKNDRRYPDGAEAILHVSAMESLNGERGTAHAA